MGALDAQHHVDPAVPTACDTPGKPLPPTGHPCRAAARVVPLPHAFGLLEEEQCWTGASVFISLIPQNETASSPYSHM